MIKNIDLLKKITIGYIAISIIAIIIAISYQALDIDSEKLDKDWTEQSQSIQGLKDGLKKTKLTIEPRKVSVTSFHPEKLSLKDKQIIELQRISLQQYRNDIENIDSQFSGFFEGLDLIQRKSDKIKFLQDRVYGEKDKVKYVFGFIITLGLALFINILIAVKERAKLRNKDKKEWFNATAHQLRKSVIPLRLGVSNLLKLSLTKSERDETLKIIDNDAKQLEILTNKMLDLYRLGEVESIKRTDFDIDLLVKQVIEGSEFLNTKELKISYSLEGENKTISGDLIYAEQAIINLIDNAIGFSHSQGEILVKIFKRGGYIVVNVIDQGVGIEDKHKILSGMLNPTRRTDEHGSVGHGLGLKLVRRIMKLHGGKFDINNNKDGKGVTATIEFPL